MTSETNAIETAVPVAPTTMETTQESPIDLEIKNLELQLALLNEQKSQLLVQKAQEESNKQSTLDSGSTPEVNNLNATEVVQNATPIAVESQEKPVSFVALGQERYNKGVEKIAAVKERTTTAVKNIFSRLKSFGSKAAEYGMKTLFATLAAPEAGLAAAKFVGNKAEQGIGATAQVLDKGLEKWDSALDRGAMAVEGGVIFVGTQMKNMGEYTAEKVKAAQQFTAEKIELTKDIAFYVQEKTAEGLDKAEAAIAKRYNGLKTYATESAEFAGQEYRNIKIRFYSAMNNIRVRRMEAMQEKAEKARKKILMLELSNQLRSNS